MAKLRYYGVCGMILRWIESWLSNRYQCVRVGCSSSSLCRVISGVPQGSVLGPVLFILFVNDIVCCMAAENVSVKLFADDAKIYTVIDNVNFSSSMLQHSLDLVESWANHWQLKLSPTKCSVMRLNPKRAVIVAPTYSVGGILCRLLSSARI